MRLHGSEPESKVWDVFLDGERVRACVEADDQEGWVTCLRTAVGADGKPTFASFVDGGPALERRTGHVEFRATAHHKDHGLPTEVLPNRFAVVAAPLAQDSPKIRWGLGRGQGPYEGAVVQTIEFAPGTPEEIQHLTVHAAILAIVGTDAAIEWSPRAHGFLATLPGEAGAPSWFRPAPPEERVRFVVKSIDLHGRAWTVETPDGNEQTFAYLPKGLEANFVPQGTTVEAKIQGGWILCFWVPDAPTPKAAPADCACGKGRDSDGDGDCPACAHKDGK